MCRRRKAAALANFKYKLKTIIVSRLISWLKLPKERRKRAERRNKAALELYSSPIFLFFNENETRSFKWLALSSLAKGVKASCTVCL
jgi:hypothetical protein